MYVCVRVMILTYPSVRKEYRSDVALNALEINAVNTAHSSTLFIIDR